MRRSFRSPAAIGCVAALGVAAIQSPAPSAMAQDRDGRVMYASMVGRTLFLRGARAEIAAVTVDAVHGGVRVGSVRRTRINGGSEPVLFPRRPRRVVVDGRVGAEVRVRLRGPDDGSRPWRLRGVSARGRAVMFVSCERIESIGRIRMKGHRSELADISVSGCNVSGPVELVIDDRTQGGVNVIGSTLSRGVEVRSRAKEPDDVGFSSVGIVSSTVARLDVDTPGNHLNIRIVESTIEKDVTTVSAGECSVEESTVSGSIDVVGTPLAVPPGVRAGRLYVTDSTVAGSVRVASDESPDLVFLYASSVGTLDVALGGGDDELSTEQVSIAGTATFDGGDGALDRWVTDDVSLVETVGVEETVDTSDTGDRVTPLGEQP